jgi:predicted phosphodiesterase
MDETVLLDGALLCHASPRSDMETFAPEASGMDDELLSDEDPEVIVFGHSHLQFIRSAGDRLLVNPGSVGIPFDGDRRAAYALWDGARDFELRRVEYDWRAYLGDVKTRMAEALGDALGTLAARVEQARFVQ